MMCFIIFVGLVLNVVWRGLAKGGSTLATRHGVSWRSHRVSAAQKVPSIPNTINYMKL